MYLAQVNIAKMKDAADSELMSDFVSAIDAVNEVAEAAPGFIWRLKGDENNALAIRVFEDNYLLINMSIWKDVESLKSFLYSGKHLDVYRKKKKWFHEMDDHHMAMWFVPLNEKPTPQEAKQKLEHLNKHGETIHAFTFRSNFNIADLK